MISELGVELNCFFGFRWSRNLVVFGLLVVIRLNSLWQLQWKKGYVFSKKMAGPKKISRRFKWVQRLQRWMLGTLGAKLVHFWGISWMTLMTTKEKAAKEVLAQAQAPPTLGQQQATKGSIYIALGFSIIGGRVYIIPKRGQYICIWYITYVYIYIYPANLLIQDKFAKKSFGEKIYSFIFVQFIHPIHRILQASTSWQHAEATGLTPTVRRCFDCKALWHHGIALMCRSLKCPLQTLRQPASLAILVFFLISNLRFLWQLKTLLMIYDVNLQRI